MHVSVVSRPLNKYGIEGQRPVSVDWHMYFGGRCSVTFDFAFYDFMCQCSYEMLQVSKYTFKVKLSTASLLRTIPSQQKILVNNRSNSKCLENKNVSNLACLQ